MAATSAIIPASGLGRRLSSVADKAFVSLADRPLVAHTLSAFQESPDTGEIILVVRSQQIEAARRLVTEFGFSKVKSVVVGGEVRQDSVRNGLAEVSDGAEIVTIHDAARPFVEQETIAASIAAANLHGAAIAAVPVIDTIKSSEDGLFVDSTLDRSKLYAVQTPQTFRRDIIETAYERAYADGYVGTDDASLVERIGQPVAIVPGSYRNIKITTPTDIKFAEAMLLDSDIQHTVPEMRVGHGYDVHRFAPNRKLFLGGVEFPDEEGLLGHSDADVLLHAVADAVLGAAGAGDIGRHFPDTDPAYKDIRGTLLLARAGEVVGEIGWRVGNVDVTLIAERPKIAGYATQMQANIAEALHIDPAQVSVKASTREKLGPIGEGQGIECHAVALLFRTT